MNIKTVIIKSLKDIISDRYLLILILALILVSIIFSISTGLSIKPSELQLVAHYSAFGITHLYREQWYYLLSFVFSGLIFSFFHIAIASKLLEQKGRSFAIAFVWLGIAVVLFGCWVTSSAVINVWKPL